MRVPRDALRPRLSPRGARTKRQPARRNQTQETTSAVLFVLGPLAVAFDSAVRCDRSSVRRAGADAALPPHHPTLHLLLAISILVLGSRRRRSCVRSQVQDQSRRQRLLLYAPEAHCALQPQVLFSLALSALYHAGSQFSFLFAARFCSFFQPPLPPSLPSLPASFFFLTPPPSLDQMQTATVLVQPVL